jgi:hypothetical protein
MTTIPVKRKSIKSSQDVTPISPAKVKQQSTKYTDTKNIKKLSKRELINKRGIGPDREN